MDAQIIEALGKLGTEVVAILSLAGMVWWVGKSNSALAKSHETMAGAQSQMASAMVTFAASLDKNTRVTEKLVEKIDDNPCRAHEVAKKVLNNRFENEIYPDGPNSQLLPQKI